VEEVQDLLNPPNGAVSLPHKLPHTVSRLSLVSRRRRRQAAVVGTKRNFLPALCCRGSLTEISEAFVKRLR
jgi:hypothetical protein